MARVTRSRRQLPAGRGDVASPGEPDGRRHASSVELRLERRDRVTRRAPEATGRVVRDEVDLVRLPAEERRELPRLRRRVVDAREHHVLDEDSAIRPLPVAAAEREHVGEGIAVVDRHELASQSRVGSVEREREPDGLGHLLDEPGEPGEPAHGRDRRPTRGDANVGQAPRGVEDLVDVHQRLSHAHEDEMVQGLGAAEVEHLVDDLGGREIASERHRPRGAERAREGAARLRGDADRAATVPVAHQDGLDGMAVVRAKERLHGAVGRRLLRLGDEGRERELRSEPRAEREGQIRHLVIALDAAREPLPDLAGAVGGLAGRGEVGLEEFEIHVTKIGSREAAEEVAVFARVTTYELEEGRASESIAAFAPAIEGIRSLDGLVDAYFLVERDGGRAVSLTVWDSVDAMERGRMAATRARTEAAQAAGAEVMSTYEYEVGVHTAVAAPERAVS